MKRSLHLTLLVVVIALVGTIVHPQWLDAARPHAPDFLQKLFNTPDSGGTPGSAKAATPANKAGAVSRRGGASIAVTAAAAESGELPVIERTYGIMQSPAIVQIATQIASQVTAVHVKDGQDVRVGDLLVTLDDRTLQAQLQKDEAALLKDKAVALSAASDLRRAKVLVDQQAGTQQAYEQAIATNESGAASVSADEAAIAADRLQIGFTRITAPISGRLGPVNASVGNLVNTTSPTAMMAITVITPLKVGFKLPETLLQDIRSGLAGSTPIRIRVFNSGGADTLGTGELDFLDSSIDNASGTIALSATIDNAALKLWPGQHVDVEAALGMLHPVALVPTVAVEAGQSGPFVWLIKNDSTVEARPVTVTRSESGQSAIAAGVVPGDRVVVEGQLKLKPGAPVMVAGMEAPAKKLATHVDSVEPAAATGDSGRQKSGGANQL